MKEKIIEIGKQQAKERQEKMRRKRKLLRGLTFTFVAAFIVVFLFLILFKNRSSLKYYETKYFTLEYDTTWKISKEEEQSISLLHKTNSIIDIKMNFLSLQSTNQSIEDLVQEVRYDIEQQEGGYNLLKQEEKLFTTNQYQGYQLLYENGQSQSLIIVIKSENKFIIINYISNNEYFDILLDSFQTVVGSLEIK